LQKLRDAPGRKMMVFYDDAYDYDQTWLPLSRNKVEARICWDMLNLYFLFRVSDDHLFAQMQNQDKYPDIHLNDGVEIYIDTKADSKNMMDINDYQFTVDVSGQSIVFRGDRDLIESDTMTAPKESGQNVFFEYKTVFNGTLNDTLPDEYYIVEMAIPFAAIGLKPTTGMLMFMDICNNDMDYSLNGVSTYEEKAKRYWPFNWTGISDFGYPETWVPAQLTGSPGWLDNFSVNQARKWFTVYLLSLAGSVMIILLLILRMRRIRKMPVKQEMSASKVVFLAKHKDEDQTELTPNQQLLQKATQFLTDNVRENINSELLARELGVSIRKLQRITNEEISSTPTNFIYMVKLNLAADYLKNKKGNVSETAYEFGFSDPGYFSKLFKKHFGLSPVEFLESEG
jgi:AraC-like DNA-binding protein